MIDSGLLSLKDPSFSSQEWQASSALIIEWRALTIYLLDKLNPIIRDKLGLSEEQFPLAKVLEGGTWSAGRQLAIERRGNTNPPINILSDGTVF